VLGLLVPVVLVSKKIMQRLWQIGLGWDDPIPTEVLKDWTRWTSELPTLADLSFKRCYYQNGKEVYSQGLHGFSDASQDGYARVIYLRVVYTDATVNVALVYSKSKVAPLKSFTIPKLKLCGALILAKTLCYVAEQLQLPVSDSFAWTDSTIVLC